MSADNNKIISIETDRGVFCIGGVPKDYSRVYGVVLLSARPEGYGELEAALSRNPQLEIYATAAALRSVKQILNCAINERVIKNGAEIEGYVFKIAPDISWIDRICVYKDGELVLGEEAADADDTPKSGMPVACIIYSSRYGFTKALALSAADELSSEYSVRLIDADTDYDAEMVNNCDILLVGTNTINRNAPKSIWNVITSIDLARKRGMRYLVFGSFGWAGDGIKLIHSTLKEMGMRAVSNPVDVLFKPTDEDFVRLKKAVAKFVEIKNT